MRILFIDHTPFTGGAETALARHINHLDKKKFTPLVACSGTVPKLIEEFKRAGAEVLVIPFERLKSCNPLVIIRFWRTLQELRSCLGLNGADLVVTNTERAMYAGTLAAVLTRTKIVWWVRDFEYNRFLFRLLSRFPQKIICVSGAIRDYYEGRDNPKFEIVYVGSDFDHKLKEVSLADVLRVKRELGIQDSDFVVGFVGRLVTWKGATVLVEAARGLKGIKVLKVVIVGTGKGQKGNIEPELRRMVEERGLQNQVILTGHREDVPVLMKIFDVFCHTSIGPEPFATVVVEAMMAGVPVIGTNIGGTPEIISDRQTGFLVPPSDPQSLAKTLSYLSSERELRRRVGQAAKKLVMEKNTEKFVTSQVENIYSLFFNWDAVAYKIKN